MSKKLSIMNDPLSFIGGNEAVTLSIDDIVVEEQVRKDFGENEISELAESIKQVGIINPPVVRKKDGSYVIIDGERRLRACKLLGMDKVLCSVKDIKEEDIHAAQIIANVHRKDLTDVELYYGFKLYQDQGLSLRDIVAKTGVNKAKVEEILKGRDFEENLKTLSAGEEGNKEFRKLAETTGIADPEKKAEVRANIDKFSRSDIKKIKNNSKPRKSNKNKAKKEVSEIRTPDINNTGSNNAPVISTDKLPVGFDKGKVKEQLPGPLAKGVFEDVFKNDIETFNNTHKNIVLELGGEKDIKFHNLPFQNEPTVIKIAFKSENLVNDLISILNKAFPGREVEE